jgi:hypothetical protein
MEMDARNRKSNYALIEFIDGQFRYKDCRSPGYENYGRIMFQLDAINNAVLTGGRYFAVVVCPNDAILHRCTYRRIGDGHDARLVGRTITCEPGLDDLIDAVLENNDWVEYLPIDESVMLPEVI